MCKIILSPCRLQVEARCLLVLRGKNEMVVPHQMDRFCYFPVFSKEKKNHPPLRLEESHSEDFCTYKRWSVDFAWRAPPLHLLRLQHPTHKKEKEKKKEKRRKKYLSIRQNSNNKSPGMFAASIRLSNAKAPSTSSFNVIIQNGPISRYQAEFTFHIFTEN